MSPLLLVLLACVPGELAVLSGDDAVVGVDTMSPGTDTSPPTDTAPPPTTSPAAPHNVLILLTDDQGTDKIGVYGEHPDPPPTPHIDALAAEGLLFRNAWATPICSPTRAALLTGRTGRRTGMGSVTQYLSGKELPVSEVIIPEVLHHADPPYANAAVGKWHIGSYNGEHSIDHPVQLGFDSFAGSMGNLYDFVDDDGQRHDYSHWEKIVGGQVVKTDTYATTDTVDDALAHIATLPEPWFLYVAFNAPHTPLSDPPADLTSVPLQPLSPNIVRYPAVVEALDAEIGRLLAAIDPEVREHTTVMFLSDNGTPEHAVLPPWNPYRAKDTPFEGGLNVPMIVTGPLVTAPGSETDALVHVVDLLPTVAEIAGVSLDGPQTPVELDGLELDGVSLVPLFQDPSATVRAVVHAEKFSPSGIPPYNSDWKMTRDDRFKVMWTDNPVMPLFFDLQGRTDDGDPIPAASLPPAEAAQVEALMQAHDAYWDSLPLLTAP